ncbi:hypothetical protein KY289_030453 [Solanum tuberosum]|nr:hypothetical protein KY289_030453 [Solanum tuberosum]
MKFWHTDEGCWSKKKPIDEEEAMPQFQVVKKKRRKNRKHRKTKVEWKATGITRHPNEALVQPCKENVKEASPGFSKARLKDSWSSLYQAGDAAIQSTTTISITWIKQLSIFGANEGNQAVKDWKIYY